MLQARYIFAQQLGKMTTCLLGRRLYIREPEIFSSNGEQLCELIRPLYLEEGRAFAKLR